ncbi:hypothetical protein [Nitrosomonas sp.]|uniref:hypothetical protein n=1 Tax=Nitrosomonas sp. TaxID=42353 RepID=UPI0026105385|nr:hypothetical protein [Nitrosomonas sp.]
MTANGRLEKDATTVGFAASPVSSPLKLNVRAYMRQVLLFVVLVINIQCAVAGQLPCLAGDIEETILISLPGYDNEVGLKGAEGEQARLNAAVSSCIRGYRICLLTIDGKMLKANSLSEISVKGRSIVWGVNQILATKNRSYCVTAFVAGPTEDIGPVVDLSNIYSKWRLDGRGNA